MDAVVEALRQALGPDTVLTGDDVKNRAAGIWRNDALQAKALVRPRNTDDVRRVMELCHAHGQPVVTHGGLTGLVGGALTRPDDIVVSLERMNKIEEVHRTDRTMVVQSGVVLQTVQETAEQHGLFFPLDLGGRGSATIGGNISTNAGGNRVIRYGMARDNVLGLNTVNSSGQWGGVVLMGQAPVSDCDTGTPTNDKTQCEMGVEGATSPAQVEISPSEGRFATSDSGLSSGKAASGRLLSLASARNVPCRISGRLADTPSMEKSMLRLSSPCTTSELPL